MPSSGDLVKYYFTKYEKWFQGTYVYSYYEHFKATSPRIYEAIINNPRDFRHATLEKLKEEHVVRTRKGNLLRCKKEHVEVIYSFDQELTELLETGNIKQKEQKENKKMAKFTTIGMIAKKKDGSGSYIKIDADVTLKKGQFVSLFKKPTEEQIEANPKLKAKADKWPNFKVADLVVISDS